ncbi:D-alanyl-lipoteichoic acid biosynthesis protein DltD [Vagococcus coleopterorum]|uniref:D-alanyl-lipoteichoic acid biosynthesis protein DltD n=1 Tax=Vagococcus coleopterorum TaxID=2714946 RepID=A0A6G8ALA8_9ENTE|nr:D-alanyl-lipoteichoic acid biosynthesis protein DltD [Vagococcus coleopterorum]QIL45786.1 D-alanyl-lipoteichoic acid biosynthesis protein DltD [Vagococcus coleopterorum]
MSRNKKIVLIFGPICFSLLLVVLVFLSGITIGISNSEKEFQSTARNTKQVTGVNIRKNILQDEKYVPVYSSSEMAIFDEFHPSVLAEKYDRDYRLLIAGKDAQGSLTHFLEINSTQNEHKNKKIILIISPNSFGNVGGISNKYYGRYHSPLQIYSWLDSLVSVSDRDVYIAKRLLSYDLVMQDSTIKLILENIAYNKKISSKDKLVSKLHKNVLLSQDSLYSLVEENRFNSMNLDESDTVKGMNNFEYARKFKMKKLPAQDDYDALMNLAYEIGEEEGSNNPFGFFDDKFKRDIGKKLPTYKNSRANYQYTKSQEYSDYELLLSEVARLNMDPLIIIDQNQKKWNDYTGITSDEQTNVIKKLEYQLKKQGFNNYHITKNTYPFGYVDGAHVGRQGWVELDQIIKEFMARDYKAPEVKIDDYFFSKEWQMFDPSSN